MSRTAPVVILGEGLTALGTMRSLAHEGIWTLNVSLNPGCETRSRWYSPLPPANSQFAAIKALAESDIQQALLLPCSDSWLGFLSREKSSIPERFTPVCMDEVEVRRFTSKQEFGELTSALDIPRPETIKLITGSEGDHIPESNLKGYFLKPVQSQAFCQRFKCKGIKVSTHAELKSNFLQMKSEGFDLVLQEIIEGPASNYFYVEGYATSKGEVSALFARQRLRMYPPDFGNSTLMKSIELSDVKPAVESILRLIESKSLYGIFSAEFKRDDKDGLFKIIEINVRPWWYVEFATRCGVNIPYHAYLDSIGELRATQRSYIVDRHSINFGSDLLAMRHQIATKEFVPLAYVRSVLKSQPIIFAWRDPLPALQMGAQKIYSVFSQTIPARLRALWRDPVRGLDKSTSA